MNCFRCLIFLAALLFNLTVKSTSYNSLGQTGLINLPTAEIHNEESIYLTFTKNSFSKLGTLTITPFDWMEASYFYYRPEDLLWGSKAGSYLDKGFNVKFLYRSKNFYLPDIAIGLDDFAGTGQFTKEYVSATYKFKNSSFTSGLIWSNKLAGNSIKNPLSYVSDSFDTRLESSDEYSLGGKPSTDLWFKGDAFLFAGFEYHIIPNRLSFKIENDPYDYLKFSCCGEGISDKSNSLRKKDSNYNIGFSYKFKKFGNIDFSHIKGNTWNLSFSIGFSSKQPIRKKNDFIPVIRNKNFNQQKKYEFYYDLLYNLNQNNLYLQTAEVDESNNELAITIDSAEHINPIIYSSRAAYISKKVADANKLDFNSYKVGHITRGIQINDISFKQSDLENANKSPYVLIKRRSKVAGVNPIQYKSHEFQPIVPFPLIMNSISPDIRTHIGSPERFLFSGIGIKLTTEIQLNRNLTLTSIIGQNITNTFDKKVSEPNSLLPKVRTEIVDYLQESNDLYIKILQSDYIAPIKKNIYARLSFGYLEEMYGGISTEILYKPFSNNFALSAEFNKVKKRNYDGRFDFLEYKTHTSHLNTAYYHPQSNILLKLSYGEYLAGDRGYTFDISRRMPSGWQSGFYFTRTNVSEVEFGEGSFDKGFYFKIPFNIFQKKYSKNSIDLSLKTMTRDGGQKLIIQNKLIDSFYGSSFDEINENWNSFLD